MSRILGACGIPYPSFKIRTLIYTGELCSQNLITTLNTPLSNTNILLTRFQDMS